MSYAPLLTETNLNDSDFLNLKTSHFPQENSNKANSKRSRKTRGRAGDRQTNSGDYSIIVHCHLCWDWVWQRPQQFVSRLSRRHRVLFVETVAPDPELAAPLVRFRKLPEFPNITILRLQFPCWRWNDGEYVDAERRRLVQEFLAGPGKGDFERPVQWFYDPMAVPAFAGQMGEAQT
jgi:hypothetical protein